MKRLYSNSIRGFFFYRGRELSIFKTLLLCAVGPWSQVAGGGETAAATFPRLMGLNIGAKNYQDVDYQKELARMDVVILGFYRGWQPAGYAPTATLAMRRVVKALKEIGRASCR